MTQSIQPKSNVPKTVFHTQTARGVYIALAASVLLAWTNSMSRMAQRSFHDEITKANIADIFEMLDGLLSIVAGGGSFYSIAARAAARHQVGLFPSSNDSTLLEGPVQQIQKSAQMLEETASILPSLVPASEPSPTPPLTTAVERPASPISLEDWSDLTALGSQPVH